MYRIPALILMLLLAVPAAAFPTVASGDAPAIKPFTATYEVLRNGSPVGVSTLTLAPGAHGRWNYRSTIRATHGLAALFGADMHADTLLRWRDGRPETVSYDYRFDAAFKHKRDWIRVDWGNRHVRNVVDGRHDYSYAAEPGMVESHAIPLALLVALRRGERAIDLPVAVKDRVEHQQFKVAGPVALKVPAGDFQALRVSRVGDDKAFTAWFDTGHRYETPIKLSQRSGGQLTLVLKSYRQP